jgi:salicylate hydroxylase
MGPGAQIVHYPIAGGTLMNFTAYVHDPDEWPPSAEGRLTARAAKDDVVRVFSSWGDAVLTLVQKHFPEEDMERWGAFDMADHPLDTYAFGRVCLVGDAAHASTPHQ